MDDLVTVESSERLRELIGEVGERARRKVRPRLDADDRRWLQASSLCFVATSDGQQMLCGELRGPATEDEHLGLRLAQQLRTQGAEAILQGIGT